MLQLRNAIAVKIMRQDAGQGYLPDFQEKSRKSAHFIRIKGNKCLMEIEHDSYWGGCARQSLLIGVIYESAGGFAPDK